MSTTWYAGSLVTSTATFLNASGTPTAPSTVTLKYWTGSGSVQTVTSGFTNPSTGIYSYELDTTSLPGNWTVEWIGTGSVQAIEPSAFTIMQPPL